MNKLKSFLRKLKLALKSGTFFKFELATVIALIVIMIFSTAWYVLGSIKANKKLTNDIINVQDEMINFTYVSSKFFSVDIENFNYLITRKVDSDADAKFAEEYIVNILNFSNYLHQNTYYAGIDSILHKKTVLYHNFVNRINSNKALDDHMKYDMVAMNTEYNMEILAHILSSKGMIKELNTQKVLTITEKIRENHIKLLIIFSITSPVLILCMVLMIYDLKKIYKDQFRKDVVISSLMNK